MDMNTIIDVAPNPNIPLINPGDTVKVSVKIKEGDHERIQPFQGIVIGVRKGKINSSFTVRRSAYGIGVERTFFFYSPMIESVEIIQRGKVRRAKLYYLRGLSTKATRAKIKAVPRIKSTSASADSMVEEILEPESIATEVEDILESEAEE